MNDHGVECIILAPSTMAKSPVQKKKKTDRRDSEVIARCLAHHSYHKVHVPTSEEEQIKEFIRMRDDLNQNLKSIKQQIIALLTRNGKHYGDGSHWTGKHIKWINEIHFDEELLNETLAEYMIEYHRLLDRIVCLDARIEEMNGFLSILIKLSPE